MTIRGLEPLLAFRKEGKLPSRTVLLFADPVKPRLWAKFGDCLLMPEGAVTMKDDMRVLVGLDVILLAQSAGAVPFAIFHKLKEYARSVMFVVLPLNDGYLWDKTNGERAL